MTYSPENEVGRMDIAPELQRALERCKLSREDGFDYWDFSIEAIEYLATWSALRARIQTRDYLAALAAFAAVEDEPEYSAARDVVIRERRKLLFAVKEPRGLPQ